MFSQVSNIFKGKKYPAQQEPQSFETSRRNSHERSNPSFVSTDKHLELSVTADGYNGQQSPFFPVEAPNSSTSFCDSLPKSQILKKSSRPSVSPLDLVSYDSDAHSNTTLNASPMSAAYDEKTLSSNPPLSATKQTHSISESLNNDKGTKSMFVTEVKSTDLDGSDPDQNCEKSTIASNVGIFSEEADLGDPPLPVYKSYKRRWIGLLALALLNIMTSWGWLSFSALSTETTELFAFTSDAPVNWLSTVILFAYVSVSPLCAWVLTRKNIKFAMTVCAVLCSLGNWLRYIGVVRKQFWLLMLGQILIGFAQPFALSSTGYYTDMWFTSRSRVSANAISTIANPLGGAIAQLVGPAIVSTSGDLKKFILLTAILSSAFGLIVLIVPDKPPLPPCPSATIVKLPLRESLRALVHNKLYLALLTMFSAYVGLFNAYSTFINQIMEPYGYSSDQAGITGAVLIVAGIVCCAITSPIIDRTHNFILLIKITLPIMGICYICLNFTSTTSGQLIGPYLVSGVLGAVSFSILPVLLEWVQEQTSPVTPALSSAILWNGGNLLGGILIIAMNALKYGADEGSPPGNMKRSLILQTVVGCVAILPVWFVKQAKDNSRVKEDL